jgi:hypothetical protein
MKEFEKIFPDISAFSSAMTEEKAGE